MWRTFKSEIDAVPSISEQQPIVEVVPRLDIENFQIANDLAI